MYKFHFFKFQNKQYWHVYGNTVPYNFGPNNVLSIYAYAEKHYPDFDPPPNFGIKFDYSLPVTFSNAMSISRSVGTAVLVPKLANAIRKNSQELVDDFTCFNFGLIYEEKLAIFGFDTLLAKRLTDSIAHMGALFDSSQKLTKDL